MARFEGKPNKRGVRPDSCANDCTAAKAAAKATCTSTCALGPDTAKSAMLVGVLASMGVSDASTATAGQRATAKASADPLACALPLSVSDCVIMDAPSDDQLKS
jgi:hypothetical protein